jgi:hypothetical protein
LAESLQNQPAIEKVCEDISESKSDEILQEQPFKEVQEDVIVSEITETPKSNEQDQFVIEKSDQVVEHTPDLGIENTKVNQELLKPGTLVEITKQFINVEAYIKEPEVVSCDLVVEKPVEIAHEPIEGAILSIVKEHIALAEDSLQNAEEEILPSKVDTEDEITITKTVTEIADNIIREANLNLDDDDQQRRSVEPILQEMFKTIQKEIVESPLNEDEITEKKGIANVVCDYIDEMTKDITTPHKENDEIPILHPILSISHSSLSSPSLPLKTGQDNQEYEASNSLNMKVKYFNLYFSFYVFVNYLINLGSFDEHWKLDFDNNNTIYKRKQYASFLFGKRFAKI